MNYLVAGLGANITVGLISAITATTNSVYTLSTNISKSTSTGSEEIKQIIKETDLETKIKVIQYLLCEINIDEHSPNTIHYCIKSINDAINDILDELEKINYRMQYNNNIWVGASIRSYGFKNCRRRLIAYVKTLENRYTTLMSILSVKDKMYRKRTTKLFIRICFNV
jgi:hypothetical protein